MGFWKTIAYKWEEKEVKEWPSMKKTAYLLLPLLLYLVIHDICEILLWAGLDVMMQYGSDGMKTFLTAHTDTVRGMINGGAILIGTAFILPVIRSEVKGEDEKKRKRTIAETVTGYAFLLALSFCAAVGINILFSLLGFTGSSQHFTEVREIQYGVSFAIGLVLYGVISPIAEEAVFRGILYNRMKRCFSVRIALIFSALLFGCYHGNMVQAVYGTILGTLIAYLYEIMGGFEIPILFHSMANISVYVITYNNSLSQTSRMILWIMAVAMLTLAIGMLVYIKKKCKVARE